MVIRGAIQSKKNVHLWTSVQQVELAFTCPHTSQSVLQRPTLSRLAAALNLADDEYWKAGHLHWQASHKHNLSTKRISCAAQEHILLEPGRENAGIRKHHQSGEIPCDHPGDTKCLFGNVWYEGDEPPEGSTEWLQRELAEGTHTPTHRKPFRPIVIPKDLRQAE